jgi:hypothetical protein
MFAKNLISKKIVLFFNNDLMRFFQIATFIKLKFKVWESHLLRKMTKDTKVFCDSSFHSLLFLRYEN